MKRKRAGMTRINCVPPSWLSTKHLIAEHYELPRIFTAVRKAQAKGKMAADYGHYREYKMGRGHVCFFYTRLLWLVKHFYEIKREMQFRGMKVKSYDVDKFTAGISNDWFGSWLPCQADYKVNLNRLNEREIEIAEAKARKIPKRLEAAKAATRKKKAPLC